MEGTQIRKYENQTEYKPSLIPEISYVNNIPRVSWGLVFFLSSVRTPPSEGACRGPRRRFENSSIYGRELITNRVQSEHNGTTW